MHRGQRWAMMISRVPPSALSHLHPGLRLAGPARPLIGVEERGVAGAAARGRRAAPHQASAPPGLGRPRRPGRADPAPAQKAAGAPAGHARHRAPVAPPPGQKEVDLPEPDGPAAGQRRDRRAHRAARHRERLVGIPAHPGRAAETRSPGQRVHDPPGPQGAADPAGSPATYRYDLAAVPALPSRDHAGRRLLPCGLRGNAPAPVLPVRHGSRLPLRAHPRGHRPPGRPVDHPADPQPAHGPR